ncbi:MAG: TIGR02530 family flagellar biosynthesis protein [Gaiellaceae bacterium]
MVDRLHGSPKPQPEPPLGLPAPTTGPAFADVLAGRLAAPKPVQFSGHALQRIERRGIPLDEGAVARLAGGVDRAAAKGSRSSLVLVDETAFVVSVPNRTVVTAVDREHMREQVFTNIDSAVIA